MPSPLPCPLLREVWVAPPWVGFRASVAWVGGITRTVYLLEILEFGVWMDAKFFGSPFAASVRRVELDPSVRRG